MCSQECCAWSEWFKVEVEVLSWFGLPTGLDQIGMGLGASSSPNDVFCTGRLVGPLPSNRHIRKPEAARMPRSNDAVIDPR